MVNNNGYNSSGDIIHYGIDYWRTPADTKHFHSSFLEIDKETGECY